MTMCVFWKDKANVIHMATDSRLNNGKTTLDHCLKISRLNCELYEADSIVGGNKILKGTVKLAISFCGGFVSAYTIKESLAEILNQMVFVPDTSNASMDVIAEVAFNVYKKITTAILAYYMELDGACSVYIAGFCPLSKQMEMYKLSVKIDSISNQVVYSKTKCFEQESFIIDGSGATFLKKSDTLDNHFAKAYAKNKEKPLLDILYSVISDPACNSVGGSIQYAKCQSNDITLHSMYEYNNGSVRYMRAGVDINELINDVIPLGVIIEANMIGRSI